MEMPVNYVAEQVFGTLGMYPPPLALYPHKCEQITAFNYSLLICFLSSVHDAILTYDFICFFFFPRILLIFIHTVMKRYCMLDGPDTSSNMEKLEREVHRRAKSLVNVSLPPSSRFTSSILLRIYNDQGINYLTDFCRCLLFFFLAIG